MFRHSEEHVPYLFIFQLLRTIRSVATPKTLWRPLSILLALNMIISPSRPGQEKFSSVFYVGRRVASFLPWGLAASSSLKRTTNGNAIFHLAIFYFCSADFVGWNLHRSSLSCSERSETAWVGGLEPVPRVSDLLPYLYFFPSHTWRFQTNLHILYSTYPISGLQSVSNQLKMV